DARRIPHPREELSPCATTAHPPRVPDPSPPPSAARPPPSVSLELASSSPAGPADPVEWRPFAAMVITGLSLPLAYWSRTVVPVALAKARASLPGPANRVKSIRGELGA